MDFADIKASVPNVLFIGLSAIVVIALLKAFSAKVYIPGFSEVITSV